MFSFVICLSLFKAQAPAIESVHTWPGRFLVITDKLFLTGF